MRHPSKRATPVAATFFLATIKTRVIGLHTLRCDGDAGYQPQMTASVTRGRRRGRGKSRPARPGTLSED